MARIDNNLILKGVSGMIGGQLVVRQTENGGVLAVRPRRSDHELSEEQQAQQEKFRQAVIYGKGAQHRPEYQERAGGGKSAFNVATSDCFHPPEILAIEVEDYSGRIGDVVTVRAIDDVEVREVGILISAENNRVVEKGSLVRDENDRTLWHYTATAEAGADHVRIIVDVADLASQVTTETVEKDL